MGILFVLIFYGIALTVAASIGAIAFGVASYHLTKQSGPKRKRAVLASIIFPFACEAFAAGWFVAYAITNYTVFHRDPGLGDSWDTPLPNGYALMMIDTTDQGTVYDPKTQRYPGSVGDRDDTEFGVRQLQVSKALIFGARDSGYFSRIGQDSKAVDTFFEIDTINNRRSEFKSLEELRAQAAHEGVTLNLRGFSAVFDDYRWTWFDYLAGSILLLTPAAGFLILAIWIWRLRKAKFPHLAAPADG